MKEFIKEYYQMGLFSDVDLELFVKSGDITEDEKQEIINKNKT